ncbi:MAG TPA: hypothetical protein VF017_09375 [Thermoanaerobaculia bacterium]|nr:hypothetical protein [Thermoanaerobaculia bacterium]
MVKPPKLRVMISSRSASPVFGGTSTLEKVRADLASFIDGATLFDEPLFETWTHEQAQRNANYNAYEDALVEATECHILLALYNGEAGSVARAGDVGICHRELETGRAANPAKVYLVALLPLADLPADLEARERDERFRLYVKDEGLFQNGRDAKDCESLKALVGKILRRAVADEAIVGARQLARNRLAYGAALDWSHLDFQERKAKLEEVCREGLADRGGTVQQDPRNVLLSVAGRPVLWRCHGVPAALSIPAARELVGQPFFKDHELNHLLAASRGGPVHLIACHRRVTESQALRILGVPDATVVNAEFGIYLAEETHKIQLVFLSDCRTETKTREALQRFFAWLEVTKESQRLAERAASRAKIVAVIAGEGPR